MRSNLEESNTHSAKIVLFLIASFAFLVYFLPTLPLQLPLGDDPYYHMRIAKMIINNHEIPSWDAAIAPDERSHAYPPLFHILLASLSVVSTLSLESISKILPAIIAAITTFAVYLFVQEFIKARLVALLSALFFALAIFLTETYLLAGAIPYFLDIPLTLAFFLFSLRCVSNDSPRSVLYGGISLGALVLLHFSWMIFFAVPWIYVLLTRRKKIPLFLVSVVGLLIASTWYLPFFVKRGLLKNIAAYNTLPLVPTLQSYSGFALFNFGLLIFLAFLGVLGVNKSSKEERELQKFLLVWVATLLASWLITSYNSWVFSKEVGTLLSDFHLAECWRFLGYLLIPISLLAVFGALSLQKRAGNKALVFLVLLIAGPAIIFAGDKFESSKRLVDEGYVEYHMGYTGLAWLEKNTGVNDIILTYRSHYAPYYAKRKVVLDSFILAVPNALERYRDVELFYNYNYPDVFLASIASKYNVSYIFFSGEMLNRRSKKVLEESPYFEMVYSDGYSAIFKLLIKVPPVDYTIERLSASEFKLAPLNNASNYLYMFDEGKRSFLERRYDEALIYLGRAVELNPNFVDALGYRGMTLNNLGKYEEAIEYYNKILKIDPNNKNAWHNKGGAFLNLKKYNEAVECFSKVLEIDPSNKAAKEALDIARVHS